MSTKLLPIYPFFRWWQNLLHSENYPSSYGNQLRRIVGEWWRKKGFEQLKGSEGAREYSAEVPRKKAEKEIRRVE